MERGTTILDAERKNDDCFATRKELAISGIECFLGDSLEKSPSYPHYGSGFSLEKRKSKDRN